MAQPLRQAFDQLHDNFEAMMRQENIPLMEQEAETFKVIGIVALIFANVFIAFVVVACFFLPLVVPIVYGGIALVGLATGIGTIAKYVTIKAKIAESRREEEEFWLVRMPLRNHRQMVRMALFMERDERLAQRETIPAGERLQEVQADFEVLQQILHDERGSASFGDAKREFFRRNHREALCSIETNQTLLLAHHENDLDLFLEVTLERMRYSEGDVRNEELIRRNMLADYAGIEGFEEAYDQYMQEQN